MSSVRPNGSSAAILPFPARQSLEKKSAPLSTACVGGSVVFGRFDQTRFYAGFPDIWMAFLRAHFHGPVAVAHHFGVTERAAAKWWDGIGGPRGDKVAVALMTVPGAADALLCADQRRAA